MDGFPRLQDGERLAGIVLQVSELARAPGPLLRWQGATSAQNVLQNVLQSGASHRVLERFGSRERELAKPARLLYFRALR